MNFNLSHKETTLKNEIIEFAKAQLNDKVIERDKAQHFDHQAWLKCGQQQLQGLVVDKKYGGRGLTIRETIVALEALGYGCRDNGLSFAIGAHFFGGVIPIWLYGTAQQKQNLLPALCNGTSIIANAASEPQSGSDVFNMRTIASKKDNGYILQGKKTYCSNAPVSDIALAYAITDEKKGTIGGISAFILHRKLGHFQTTARVDKMGLRTCQMSDVIFEDISITKEELLGQEGGGTVIFNKSMIWERIGLSALHLGSLSYIFEEVIRYVKKRKAFGQSLSKYQAISHKLADIKVEIEAARYLIFDAAFKLEHKKSANLAASMCKLKTSELYKRAALDILQMFGANGYINNSDIERTVRDAVASTLYSGSSEIQKNIIARRLGL